MSARLPQNDELRSFDRAFAETLRRRDPDTDPRVLDAAAQASFAIAQGHAAWDCGTAEEAEGLHAALRASRWIATPAPDLPADAALPEDRLVAEVERRRTRR